MSILYELTLDATWDEFLQYKLEKRQLSELEKKEWSLFIGSRKYRIITDRLMEEGYTFDFPVKKLINKKRTGKKRTVYFYGKTESMVLKVMSYLLYRYDSKMSPCCYSFRRNISARQAIRKAVDMPGIAEKYCLKADISNYFNSIPAIKLCEELRNVIQDDPFLAAFLERLLMADKAYENGILIEENRGAMAGVPISPFLANIYLRSLDFYFEEQGIPYFRYSDDILLFSSCPEDLRLQKEYLESYLTDRGLLLNPEKVEVRGPGEEWNFLGFCYRGGKIDLAPITMEKLKGKIRRKARALYRWRCQKGVEFDKTAKVMIRIFNRKFYDDRDEHAFTWSRWFFPVLTTDEGLREMDTYLLSYIRYLASGRHYKGNYRIRYDTLKMLGYRSMVHEYYRFCRKEKS